MNPFRSPLRRLFLIGVGPVAGLLAAVVVYLPAVQAAIAEHSPPVAYESVR